MAPSSVRRLCKSVLPVFWFVLRVVFFMFVYIWVRGTLPRFRYDQLMAFGWKFLLPLAIANIMITALVVALRCLISQCARCSRAGKNMLHLVLFLIFGVLRSRAPSTCWRRRTRSTARCR